jgi:anti-anti-sigma factor
MYQLTDLPPMPKASDVHRPVMKPGSVRWQGAGMEFSCTVRLAEGCVVLTVAGDVDLAVHARFLAQVERWSSPATDMVIECSQVTFMDSMGLQVLAHAKKLTAEHGRDFALAAPSQPVLRVLELAGVQDLFQVLGPSSDPEPDPGLAA